MNAPISQNIKRSLEKLQFPKRKTGRHVAFLESVASSTLVHWSRDEGFQVHSINAGDLAHFGAIFAEQIKAAVGTEKIASILFSGCRDRLGTVVALSIIKRYLQDGASVILENADFTSVYDGIREVLVGESRFRFDGLKPLGTSGSRAGQEIAIISYSETRDEPQDPESIPASKNKTQAEAFVSAEPVQVLETEEETVKRAIAKPFDFTPFRSKKIAVILDEEIPDVASCQEHVHRTADEGFLDFFSTDQDQDFGNGFSRRSGRATSMKKSRVNSRNMLIPEKII